MTTRQRFYIFYTSAARVTEGMSEGPTGPLAVLTIFLSHEVQPPCKKIGFKNGIIFLKAWSNNTSDITYIRDKTPYPKLMKIPAELP